MQSWKAQSVALSAIVDGMLRSNDFATHDPCSKIPFAVKSWKGSVAR